MRILSVKLNNFRQFTGENTLNLASAGDSKVSLIYGTNGGGKTTVLSAIYWCLQGNAPYIANPRQLATRHVFDLLKENDELEVSITLAIEDGQNQFLIRRSRLVRKEMGKEVVGRADKLEFTNVEGTPVGNPQFEVNSRFPERFARFFFVPGESITEFFDSNSLENLIENIKSISEIGSYENAIELATKVEQKLLKDISDTSSDSVVTTQRDAIESIKTKILKKQEEQVDLRADETDLKNQEAELSKFLGETSEFEALIARVDALQSDIQGLELKASNSDSSLRDLILKHGYLAFTENLDSDLSDALGQLGIAISQKPLISKELLIELSNQEFCLCGQTMDELHKRHLLDQIANLSNEAPTNLENRSFKPLPIELGFDNYKSRVTFELDNNSTSKRQLLTKKALLATELNVDSSEDTKVNKFKQLQTIKLKLLDLKSELATIVDDLRELDENLGVAEKRLSKLIEVGSIQARMQANRETVSRVRQVLELELANYVDDFLEELASEINNIISRLISEPVSARLRDNFNFDLVYTATGELYGEAGGESKAKAMAMIIALYRIAARRAQSGKAIGSTALKSFPLIIDSAFGELGTELRTRVAKELIGETSQCILLLSDTQAPGVVDSLTFSDIATENLLHSYSTGNGSNVNIPTIRGKEVTWLTMNADIARTEVERIS